MVSEPPIVVGVDATADSARAVAYAVREAERAGCSLRLIHAVHESIPLGPMAPFLTSEPLVAAGNQLLAEVEREVEELSGGRVGTRVQVVLGPAAEHMVAAGEQARSIVLGHRSGPFAERMFTGSTTFGVVARTDCPVVSVPDAWDLETDHGLVVAAVDGADGSAAVLDHAFAVAAQRRARLEIVHCWQLHPVYGHLVDERSVRQEWSAQAGRVVDGLVAVAAEAHPDVPYEVSLEYAGVTDTLVGRGAEADLLVVGRHGHGGTATRVMEAVLGNVTRAVLQHARCPVGVVPGPRRHVPLATQVRRVGPRTPGTP